MSICLREKELCPVCIYSLGFKNLSWGTYTTNCWEQGRLICLLLMKNACEICSYYMEAGQPRPPVLPISHSHFPLFSSIVAKCEKLPSGHTNNALYWSLLRHDRASMWRLPASKKSYWMTSGSLALLQIDLWAVKDGQINIFCILDRIRISGTCIHLHIALTYHISIVSVAHFNRLGHSEGFLPLHPTLFQLFQSVLAVAWLCWFNRPNRNHTFCSDFFRLQP